MKQEILDKHMRLFECCIPVKGYKRSIIMDLQRSQIEFIPNDLLKILQRNRNNTISEIAQKFNEENKKTFCEYIDFLLEKEFVFFCEKEELKMFPKISEEWIQPNLISNTIFILKKPIKYDLEKVLKQVENLYCQTLCFTILYDIDFATLEEFVIKISQFTINNIYLNVNFHCSMTDEKIKILLDKFHQISKIDVFNTEMKYSKNIAPIQTHPHKLSEKNACGIISPKMFVLNLPFYTESLSFNTCINRKLCIDHNGNIKNCPSMNRIFGNIFDDDVVKIVNSSDFQSLWHITKDQIEVCKDCEFRYICTDCRCFIKDPNNLYSQPAKCGYNPYIAKWKDQDGYVPVEECGKYSKENGFVPDKEKIERMNNEIWK